MGKLPIYKWSFSIAMLVYQRVWIKIYVSYHLWKDERPMNIYKNHLWILVNVNRRLQMCDPEPYELCFNLFLNQIGSWIQLLLVNFPWFMVHQFSKMFHLWFNPIFWFPGWWFQTFFIFHFIYGMSSQPHWRSPSFFKMVKLHHQPDSHYSLDQVLITNNHYEPLLTTINHY